MTCFHRKYVLLLLTAVILFGIFIGLIVYSVSKWNSKQAIVRTKIGVIRGLNAIDGNYSMYLGVPYASVDKKNPFGPSTPVSKFKDVFNAYDDTAICPQLEDFNKTISGTLDCLHLNIYVPHSASVKNRLPVVAYIHGGRDEVGFAGKYLHGPSFLMKKNIILITLNYRLGPYGFMCLGTEEVPGNQGLKDELLALEWINKNIEAFGGDPQKVTLAGTSSSGIHVLLHLARTNQPLFQQAYFRSGLRAYSMVMNEPDVTVPLRIADDLGLKTNDTNEALRYLTLKDPLAVILSAIRLNIHFRPCVEKVFNVDGFVTKHIRDITEVPSLKNLTVLITETNNEYLYQYGPENFDDANKDIFKKVLYNIFDFDEERLDSMEQKVRQFYIGGEQISNKVKQKIIDFGSDIVQCYPTRRYIRNFIENDVKKLYYGMFSYYGERNLIRQLYVVDNSFKGATHNDDIGYMFDGVILKDNHSKSDDLIIDRLTELFGNFVKYGDPNPKPSKLLPLEWKPVTNDTLFYYKIDTNMSNGIEPLQNRMAFWDMFYKLNGKYERLTEGKWVSENECANQEQNS